MPEYDGGYVGTRRGSSVGEAQRTKTLDTAGSTPGPGSIDDAVTTAVFYLRCAIIALDRVPLAHQARVDMQDLLEVMIKQVKGEL